MIFASLSEQNASSVFNLGTLQHRECSQNQTCQSCNSFSKMVQCFLGFPEFPLFCKDLLRDLKESKSFTDVTLVGDDNIPVEAHKIVLSAHSNVFKEAVRALECDKLLIQCNGFMNKDINSLLDFMYLGETAREFKDAHVLFRIGKFLQIKHLSDECEVDQNILNKEFSIEALEVIRDDKIKSEDTFDEINTPEEYDHGQEEDTDSRMGAKIIYKTIDKDKTLTENSAEDPLQDEIETVMKFYNSEKETLNKVQDTNDKSHRMIEKSKKSLKETPKVKNEFFTNTMRSERTVVNLYNSVMESFNKVDSSKEWKSIEDTPEDELEANLCKFFLCLVKSDGSPYNSACIMTYYNSIVRYLRHSRFIRIKHNPKFDSVYETVKRRCRENEEAGMGAGINKISAFRKEDIKQAFDRGCFGRNSPEALVSVVVFNLTVHLGCDSNSDLKKLVNSDFTFGPMNQSGYPEFIQLGDCRVSWDSESSEVCPVTNIAIYQSKKTQLQQAPGMPFLLNPDLNSNAKNWFQDSAMGRNTVQSLFRTTLQKSGVIITDQKISVTSGKLSRHISFKDL